MSTKSITMAAAGVPTGPTDPNFNQVTLLLTGDGTNGAQNNTFLDSSSNNFTVNLATGSVVQGTLSPFSVGAGQWSNYFDGDGENLRVAYNAAFQFGTGDFTVEAWVYILAYTEFAVIVKCATDSSWTSGWSLSLGLVGNNQTNFYVNGSPTVRATSPPLNSWTHVAVSRSGTSLRIFMNGNLIQTLTNSANIAPSAIPLTIGADITNTNYELKGYISNVRVVKGTAVYTSNFTPPTAPLTAISGTSLLTCQSNLFVDNSSNNFPVTRSGNISVQPFSPFAPTAAYAPATNGGSGYFYGNNAALSVPGTPLLALGNSDFTLECWVYMATQATATLFGRWRSGRQEYMLYTVSGTPGFAFRPYSAGAFITSSTAIQTGVWNHLAVTRSGSSFNMYLNGVNVGSGTSSGTASNEGDPFDIGGYGGTPYGYLTGSISGLRVVIGTAITPPVGGPTSPPTAVANTRLLLNFTNAGIFDSSGKNNLETVNNAQVSTAVKQFGTGSILINTYTDGCVITSSPNVDFGTGNWTIEGWFYTGQSGASKQVLVMNLNQTTGMSMCVSTSSIEFRSNGQTDISSSGVSSNTWTYIAWVRNGNTVTIYRNGTSIASGTYTNIMGPSNFYVGPTGGLSGVSSSFAFAGYIDDLRITKGVARYTSNFTPPTAAFPLK